MAYPVVQAYKYDSLDRLSEAKESSNGSQSWIQGFGYDRYGNRTSFSQTIGSTTVTATPAIDANTNRFSSSSYTFDANGNLTVDANGNQFSYDAENHQKEVKDSGNSSLGQYFYDAEGRRVKKVAGSETTIFVYDASGQIVAEYSTAFATTQQVSYLTQDHLSSQRIVTNENGAVTDRKDHFAYGNEITSSQRIGGLGYTTAEEPRKDFTGYEKDNESGLQFAQARFFNPTHGRFTSVDPLAASATIRNPQTFNRYSYVLNSPYKFVDPLGLISESTGACGNRCRNSDGGFGSGGGFDTITGFPTETDFTFATFDQLSERQQVLLMGYWSLSDKKEAGRKWLQFTETNQRQAANFLAITYALSRTTLYTGRNAVGAAAPIFAIEIISSVSSLADERIYVNFEKAMFEAWRNAGGEYSMALEGGGVEQGEVEFHEKINLGGSIHDRLDGKKFDLTAFTSRSDMPRLQWQYSFSDGAGEVDLDYIKPKGIISPIRHVVEDRQSDVTKHYGKYIKKFGDPGLTIRR